MNCCVAGIDRRDDCAAWMTMPAIPEMGSRRGRGLRPTNPVASYDVHYVYSRKRRRKASALDWMADQLRAMLTLPPSHVLT